MADEELELDEEERAFVDRIARTAAVLEEVAEDYERLAVLPFETRQRLLMAAGRVARPGPWEKRALTAAARQRREAQKRKRDQALLDQTGIRQSRRQRVFTPWQHGGTVDRRDGQRRDAPHRVRREPPEPVGKLSTDTHCYICKAKYREVHFFYDALCPTCAALNWEKRTFQTADLRGRVALVTGGRVKIGYQAAILLLRAGARGHRHHALSP